MKINNEIIRNRSNDNRPCFLLRTRSGWITKSGRVTRDLNQKSPVRFESREAAEKYRAAYVSATWNVEIEEL